MLHSMGIAAPPHCPGSSGKGRKEAEKSPRGETTLHSSGKIFLRRSLGIKQKTAAALYQTYAN